MTFLDKQKSLLIDIEGNLDLEVFVPEMRVLQILGIVGLQSLYVPSIVFLDLLQSLFIILAKALTLLIGTEGTQVLLGLGRFRSENIKLPLM